LIFIDFTLCAFAVSSVLVYRFCIYCRLYYWWS